ncbi:zinc finger and SCAN domain-containing protein 21-like [Musca vetustissima]|uniref:zinc finger and SCAN domain-containing protein 21-like n=1 Tax=Musca vetustissima TaxID=27455 RepID=UPI002AB727E7|nr:zinc finger and SCAN domain-containing protein 21-like [Musca vetustissima]
METEDALEDIYDEVYRNNKHDDAENNDCIDCGTIVYNSKTRILRYICLYCNNNYENIYNFCQHLSEHIDDDTNITADEQELVEYTEYDEIAGDVSKDDVELESNRILSREDTDLCDLEEDLENANTTCSSNESVCEDLMENEEQVEETSNDLNLIQQSNTCYASKQQHDNEKSKNKTFEECFLQEINIEKMRTEGIVDENEPPVTPAKTFLANKNPKKKKVTTVKVIAVKNRIAEIYERIKTEQTKSQQVLPSNGYLNRSRHSSESVEQDENLGNGDGLGKKASKKIIGETLITLIPEGTKIPNTLPSTEDRLTKNMTVTSLRKDSKDNSNSDDHPSTSATNDTKSVCPACGKVFRSHFSLTIHKRTHYLESDSSVKLALACPDCNQLFNKYGQLKQHIESVHYPDGFVCKICNRRLSSLSLLERHMIKVHLDRPFNCQQCGKNFSNAVTYEEHVISHNSHKVHKCHICGRKYSTEFFLMEHMRNHKEQVPQTCVVCGKVTLRITQHMKTHTPRPKRLLSCSVCGKVFNFSSGLSHHFKIMHKLPRPPPKPRKDQSTEATTSHHHLIDDDHHHPTINCGHSTFDPNEVNHKEEEAKRVIVELIQNSSSSYPSFFPDNLSSVLEVTPPIAAREETISAVNSIVHDC